MNIKNVHEFQAVVLDGFRAELQAVRDAFGVLAGGDELKDFALAGRQPIEGAPVGIFARGRGAFRRDAGFHQAQSLQGGLGSFGAHFSVFGTGLGVLGAGFGLFRAGFGEFRPDFREFGAGFSLLGAGFRGLRAALGLFGTSFGPPGAGLRKRKFPGG
jgi:hypothetical protein